MRPPSKSITLCGKPAGRTTTRTDQELEEATRNRTKLHDDLERIQSLLKYRNALDSSAKLKEQLKKSKSLAAEVDRVEREQANATDSTENQEARITGTDLNTLRAD